MLVTLGISQVVGSAKGMPEIDGHEWSDGKLVISVVGSSEYLDIFIPIFFPFLRWHRGALGYFLLPKLL